jgi:tetratricopeptide (TPR) repeat protein
VQEAAAHYEAAVRLKPDDFSAYNNLALMLSKMDRDEDAIANFERALAIKPDYALARQNVVPEYKQLGRLLLGTRDSDSRKYYLRATQLAPGDVEAHYGLAIALMNLNEVSQAADEFQKTVTLVPWSIEAHDALARILATHAPTDGGDPNRALSEAQRACELTGYQDGLRLDTLALAYAAGGRFVEAVATEEKALRLIAGRASPGLVNQLQAHLKLFRAGHPYRAPVPPPR